MSDSMIERVASAILETMCDGLHRTRIQQANAYAYAAIAAMREPTEGMMRAADNEASMDIWHDMIEAALDG